MAPAENFNPNPESEVSTCHERECTLAQFHEGNSRKMEVRVTGVVENT